MEPKKAMWKSEFTATFVCGFCYHGDTTPKEIAANCFSPQLCDCYHEYTVEDLNEWYTDRTFDAEKIKTVDIKGHMYEDDFTGDS